MSAQNLTRSSLDERAPSKAHRLQTVRATHDVEVEDREAYDVLQGTAQKQFGHIDPALLATLVMEVTQGGDWPLREAAMQALRRRWGFAKRDALRVASRPKGHGLGLYTTRRSGTQPRPYATQLLSLHPLRASCDCPDFPHNSLGACKHVLVVLDDLHQHPNKLAAAQQASNNGEAYWPELAFHPIRPLTGEGDWLDRISLRSGTAGASAAAQRLTHWFRPEKDGPRRLRAAFRSDPAQRAALVADLLRFAEKGPHADLAQCRVDAALRSLLRGEQQRLKFVPGIEHKERTRSLRSMKQKLYAYQRTGVDRFLDSGRLLLADDMGLGKTAQAIACCHVLFQSGASRCGLLIVPASLKSQWLREWHRFTDTPVEVVDGSPSERAAMYRKFRRGFLIINYEQLLRDLRHVQEFAPELVVLDEAQRIKNWTTKTATYVKHLNPRYRLVLTGTPMENRLEELASIMQWVDGEALEPTWRLTPWHVTYAGARHLDTLRARLARSMVRRVRQEVLDQLPPRTDTCVPVRLTEEQAEEHAGLTQPIASLLARASKRPLTQKEFLQLMSLLTTQRMICNGLSLLFFQDTWPGLQAAARPTPSLLRGLFSPKLLEFRELIQTLVVDQGRKVVVFSQWRRMLQLAHWTVGDVLAGAGLRTVFFTGRESQARRTHNVVDFHDDDTARVLFATDAGGVGLNLQRAASCCINLELPWNPAVLEQRIGRVYRLGQTQPVETYSLVSEEGIEARIAGLIHGKRALSEGLFDGDSDEVLFDAAESFLKRIERVVEPVDPAVRVLQPDPEADDEDDDDDQERLALAPGADDVVAGLSPAPAPPAADASEPVDEPRPQRPQQLSDLAKMLQIRLEPDGGLCVNAPPAAAAVLVDFLEGITSQLKQIRDAAE